MPRPRQVEIAALRSALAARDQATALELAAELKTSRPTISRLLVEMDDEVVRIGAARQARYSLRRTIKGIGHTWPVRRVTETGEVRPFATLEAVRGGFRLTPVPPNLKKDYPDGHFSGLPFLFADAHPQGFLGRTQARQAAPLIGVSSDPRDWKPEETLAYLVAFGDDLPGDLVIGHEMSTRIEQGKVGAITNSLSAAIPFSERQNQYPILAERVMRGETFGSSAGGEQPKFVTWVIDAGDIARAVIVKFSTATNTLAGRRWADLLQAESLALAVLRESGLAAPPVQVIDAGVRRFLEVTRYDRIGTKGRRGVISLGSVEAGLIDGAVNNWFEAADALESQGLLDKTSATQLRRLWCFGKLIGNNDMHPGNVSFWWTDTGRYALAPIYDMLPMVFAPTQGELVSRSFDLPERPARHNADWGIATRWALTFWNRVISDPGISREFVVLAEAARDRVRDFQSRSSGGPPSVPPPALAARYPLITRALQDQQARSDLPHPRDPNGRVALLSEMSTLLAAGDDLAPLATSVFPQGITPSNFAEFSIETYRYFGADDEVRAFTGKLWTDVLRGWTEDERREFLFAAIGDRHSIFSSLDFAIEVFRQIPFSAATMLPWLRQARAKLGNDLYQRGFWGSLEAFTTRSPAEAVKVAEQWLAQNPIDTERAVVARLVGIARLRLRPGESGKTEIDALDSRLRQGGCSEWRSLFLESWAMLAADKQLIEEKALRLRDELGTQGEQELGAWCYLLSVVARADQAAWRWVHREIVALASPKLGISARFNLLVAAITAWDTADAATPVSRAQWEEIVLSLQPSNKDENGFWNRLEYFLRDIGQKAPERLLPFVERIIQVAGEAFREKIEDHRESEGFIAVFRDRNIQAEAATRLCLCASSDGRRIGLTLFGRAFVDQLDPAALASATHKQLELIFREAQRSLMDSTALGRLHAGLAPHFDHLNKELADDFYDEVAVQCKNSHGYREALKAASDSHARLAAVLAEVETFFKNLAEAAKSPALQIQVPGYRRAEQAFHRKFSRDVARSADKYSVFAQFAKKVQLLYGRNWRMMRNAGELSPSSALKELSHSFEMPRMEFVDPEGQHRRRIAAVVCINQLEM